MDLLVRDLNPSVVKEIDEKAKKTKLSRQEYLKNMLENFSLLSEINDREMEYKKHLDMNTKVMSEVAKQLEKNNELLEILMADDE